MWITIRSIVVLMTEVSIDTAVVSTHVILQRSPSSLFTSKLVVTRALGVPYLAWSQLRSAHRLGSGFSGGL